LIVDTSALLAIMLKEPERALYVSAVTGSRAKISAASYVEAALKLISEGVPEPNEKLSFALAGLEIELVPVDAEQARVAVEARLQFGKGRHPADLNYGDCFAYALARVTGEPLLYKGDDFARTDVVSVL
jgi:ribonuclease VapC